MLKLLMKQKGFGVATLHKKGLITHRQVFYKMIKKTESPGLDAVERILFGMGCTWQDWAEAYSQVTDQGKPRGNPLLSARLTAESAQLYKWFRANYIEIEDSQLLNVAMESYIADIKRFGLNPRTWLPKAPHLEEKKVKKPAPMKHKGN